MHQALLVGGRKGLVGGRRAGHLIVFERREVRSWDEKVFRNRRTAESGTEIAVWRM